MKFLTIISIIILLSSCSKPQGMTITDLTPDKAYKISGRLSETTRALSCARKEVKIINPTDMSVIGTTNSNSNCIFVYEDDNLSTTKAYLSQSDGLISVVRAVENTEANTNTITNFLSERLTVATLIFLSSLSAMSSSERENLLNGDSYTVVSTIVSLEDNVTDDDINAINTSDLDLTALNSVDELITTSESKTDALSTTTIENANTVISETVTEATVDTDRDDDGVANDADCAADDSTKFQILSYSYRDVDGDTYTISSSGTICTGENLPAGYTNTANGSDCNDSDSTKFQSYTYAYRDNDGDTYTVASSGTLCIGANTPSGYLNTANGNDCNDNDSAKYQNLTGYQDQDLDGYGSGDAATLCSGATLQTGYVSNNTDCNDSDTSKFQMLAYTYRDADNDTYTIAESSSVCSGNALPSGYANTANGDDCDDDNNSKFQYLPGYLDSDQDGYGTGGQLSICTNSSVPVGYSTNNTDCDDSNEIAFITYTVYADLDGDGYSLNTSTTVCGNYAFPTGYLNAANGNDCNDNDNTKYQLLAYTYRDADNDTYTIAESSSVCSGASLPSGYLNAANGNDCDDSDATKFQNLNGYSDSDGDTFGAGAQVSVCSGNSLPSTHVTNNTDCDDDSSSTYPRTVYPDADDDSFGDAGSGSSLVCLNANQVNVASDGSNYSTSNSDCDDTNASKFQNWVYDYRDVDGDGYTIASSGTICGGASMPTGYLTSANGNDVNDNDASVYQTLSYNYRDVDGDGYTIASSGTVESSSSLPSGYTNTANGNDCDDSDDSIYQLLSGYTDSDGDGVGSGSIDNNICSGASLPSGYAASDGDYFEGDPLRTTYVNWTHNFGSANNTATDDTARSIVIDSQGNTYVVGTFQDFIFFDLGANSSGESAIGISVYLLKINADGSYGWVRTFTGNANDVYGVAVDSNDDVYMVGTFVTSASTLISGFTYSVSGTAEKNAYLIKINSDGSYGWEKEVWGNTTATPNYTIPYGGLHIDLSTDDIYIAGYFKGTNVDFDFGAGTDLKTSNGSDAFFMKINGSDGSYAWTKTFGGAGDDTITSITQDSNGDIYLGGTTTSGSLDFDFTAGTDTYTLHNGMDAFIMKVSGESYVWTKQFWGNGATEVISLKVHNDNLYALGNLYESMTEGSYTLTAAWQGVFLLTINSDGNNLDEIVIDGGRVTNNAALDIDNSGNMYITGLFILTVDFDFGAGTEEYTSNAANGAFITKINSDFSYGWTKTIIGATDAFGRCLAVNSSGEIYAAGDFAGTLDFDFTSGTDNRTSTGDLDFFIMKF